MNGTNLRLSKEYIILIKNYNRLDILINLLFVNIYSQ